MISRQTTVRDFFSRAIEMREALDEQFRDPHKDTLKWQYFFDPDKYAYLRMRAGKAFPESLLDAFMDRLRHWCLDTLGLVPLGIPQLHLMFNGCRIGLHSDFQNGVWGYVYSLTRWEARKFTGGETLLLKDGIPSYKKHHVQGNVLYDLVPAYFNQLLVFDDRLVHSTPIIEGNMDPMDGRIAVVGHIRATSPIASDAGVAEELRGFIWTALERLRAQIQSYSEVQGTVVNRIVVAESGAVESALPLTDNLITPVTGYARADSVMAVRSMIKHFLSGLRFAARSHKTTAVIPILVPLPDLSPIEFSLTHGSSPEAIRACIDARMSDDLRLIAGSWDGDSFVIREPICGRISVDQARVTCNFDPPMWVPSQREHFRLSVREWLQAGCRECGISGS